MPSAAYELSLAGAAATDPTAVALRWPAPGGDSETVVSDLGWDLAPLVGVPDAAVDLARFAIGAYVADRLTPRGTGFSRTISLAVAVTDPDRWRTGPSDDLAQLLSWLTGDTWTLEALPDHPVEGPAAVTAAAPAPISLLSGGLDSFLGAVHLLTDDAEVRFLGHRDAAKSVRGSQARVGRWLADSYSPAPSYSRFEVRQAGTPQERSSRSRSLMFAALGVAAATGCGGSTLHVPENGYTSLNLPLHANRAGALSTRSTHPETFRRLNALLDALGVPVGVVNPFQSITKGEAMTQVAASGPPNGWLEAAAGTISCSKLDGGYLAGGDPNLNCGLCVPCLVRRGTFLAAGQPDATAYLVDRLTGSARDALIQRRRSDIEAVRYAVAAGVDEDLIDGGTWPPDQDLDATSDLVRRGLAELAAVPMP